MNIILKSDIKGLGKAFEVVKVRDGFGRNWLLPQGLALAATKANLHNLEVEKKRQAVRDTQLKANAQELAKKLGSVSVTVSVRVHEGDKLYGSVGGQEIAEKLAEAGVKIDKTLIVLDEPIKALGVFHVPVRLHADVEAKVKVWVVKAAG
ncbi:MAG TPA: 50S ribosomal protein L9 [Fibrobacteria bacterium]|nr:50S ribosomal protein L9 [Fibrobacteria bacterium]